jgi:hypothetical protein
MAQASRPAGHSHLSRGAGRPYLGPVNDRPKTTEKTTEKTVRQRRLSAALRENLKRRKAQAKGRAAAPAGHPAGEPHDSAEIAEDKRRS